MVFRIIRYNVTKQSNINFCTTLCNSVILQKGEGRTGRGNNVEWNLAAEAISLVMIGIIGVYARKGSHLPTLKNRIFQWCLTVTFSAIFTNILSTIMIQQYRVVPIWLTWIVTMVYFVLTPLMGMAYFYIRFLLFIRKALR